jgi:hypothetical protein
MPKQITFAPEAEPSLNFEPHSKKRIGYLQTLCIGPVSIPPDIKGAEPEEDAGSFKTAGSGDGATPEARGIFNKPVVGALTEVSWDCTRTAPIVVSFLCSSANRANLELMLRSTTVGTICRFAFVVYEWDWVNGGFYVRFATNKGGTATGVAPAKATGGFGKDKKADGKELVAYIASDNGDLAIELPTEPTEVSGMTLWAFKITFMPPTIEQSQELVIATSKKSKLQLPWAVQQAK